MPKRSRKTRSRKSRTSRRSRKSRVKNQRSRRSRKIRKTRNSKTNTRRKSKSRSRKSKSRSRESRKRSRKSSIPKREYPEVYKGEKHEINKFFDRIFIINLKDGIKRFNKITPRLIKQGIKYEVFNAVDGRAKPEEYGKKKKQLESEYNVKIVRSLNPPAASLVLGTMEILKKIVKNKWKYVLIMEDDVIPTKNIHKRFEEGIKELENYGPDWDMLYLGCGNQCGYRGVSYDQTYKTKHITSLSIVDKDEYNWYVGNKNDLRMPCDEDYCEKISKNLSIAPIPGGTWAYAYSYKGAKKLLELINGKITDHIDQIIMKFVDHGVLNAIAFDSPLIFHEGGILRADSSIPWMM